MLSGTGVWMIQCGGENAEEDGSNQDGGGFAVEQ